MMNKSIISYLTSRGITEKVIAQAKLDFNGNEIVIPVFAEGKPLFNKYRRGPDADLSLPKYRYEKGSSVKLYNVDVIQQSDTIYITEGELDTLVLASSGLQAVSSTGGSLSFRKEWSDLFEDKKVYIVYDNDTAGVKGAIRLQSFIPHAKVVFLPEAMAGKDITDYFSYHSIKEFQKLVAESKSYVVLDHMPDSLLPSSKKELTTAKQQFAAILGMYREEYAEKTSRNEERYWYPDILEHIEKQIQVIDQKLKRPKHVNNTCLSPDRLIRAKKYPIHEMLDFDNTGFRLCKWHNENSGSLKYYPDTNTVMCYGGCGKKDAIDVAMKVYDITFKEALEKLQ